jgi:hypothetical protein
METAIVLIIVAAALYGAVRHFTKVFSGAGKAQGDCGCGCNGCDVASADCKDADTFPMDR